MPLRYAGIDAGAAELQNLAGLGHDRVDVVLPGRIEAAVRVRHRTPEQAIGADHLVTGAAVVVDHQQMVGISIEAVEVALARRHLAARVGRHLLVEHAVAQRLGGVHLSR